MITEGAIPAAEGFEGRLFVPDGDGRRGAVVILHERYGLVQHTLDLAAKLAGDGHVAIAPDLFGDWAGDKDALRRGDVRVVLPDAKVSEVIDRCVAYLARHPRVAPDRIALMGVCQSGRYPLVAASGRTDVAACVVFYGAANDRDWGTAAEQPRPMAQIVGGVRAPSLLVFGEGDHTISIDHVRRLRGALEDARCSYRMRVFADVPHGWLNDTMPGRYRPDEAREAWAYLLAFLDDVFERRWPGTGRVRWEFSSDSGTDYDFKKNRRYE